MSDYLLAAFLGVVEGFTEFLPISSTAHLRIMEALLGIDLKDGFWKMFSIVIQLGAILCLPIYFRTTLASFISNFPRGPKRDKTIYTHPVTLIFIAFVCTAVPSLILNKVIGEHLESLTMMGYSFIVGGIVMWVVDKHFSNRGRTKSVENVSISQAVVIGGCQSLAPLFPGTSRSMATIASGQIAGMTRPVALEFSFLLSIPTLVAATGYDFLKFVRASRVDPGSGAHLGGHGIMLILIGSVVSFAVAYGVVAWFMDWVRQHGFTPFAIYRIIAGILVLWFIR